MNFEQWVEEVIDMVGCAAPNKEIRLVENIIDGDFEVLLDQGKTERVLVDLMGGAVKFSREDAQAEISSMPLEDDSEGKACFWVGDEGPGVPPGMLEKTFEKFAQVEKQENRRSGRSGLRFAITGHIVELHRGRVWVESAGEKGAVFYCEIPASRKRKTVHADRI